MIRYLVTLCSSELRGSTLRYAIVGLARLLWATLLYCLTPEAYMVITPQVVICARKAQNLRPDECRSLLAYLESPAIVALLGTFPADRDLQGLLDVYHATVGVTRPDLIARAIWEADQRQLRRGL